MDICGTTLVVARTELLAINFYFRLSPLRTTVLMRTLTTGVIMVKML